MDARSSMMDGQARHAMLATPTQDEAARQMFVKAMREHLSQSVVPGTRVLYETRAVAAFERAHGRRPQSRDEVRKALFADPYYQMWSALQRSSQELIWDSVIDTLDHDLAARVDTYRKLAAARPAGGTLTLDPALGIPRYVAAADIHLMPGGYHVEFTADDVSQGALYDRGLYLYIAGHMGPENDGLGRRLAEAVCDTRPGWQPTRILDIGCGAGHQTLPWRAAYPDAEVHGIDVAPGLLRYGHARAEAMGVPVHLHQMNAEATAFPDGHFDLVVSCLFLHETSNRALRAILAECRRLLAPGGLMAHLDVPQHEDSELFQSVLLEWEEWNNNENFARLMKGMDLAALARDAGFAPEKIDRRGLAMTPGGQTRAYNAGSEIAWTLLMANA
jgi:SAM-dependent methyltransferase